MEKHGIDILYAAQIFENPVLTKADKRMDYGEGRWISLGVIENECFIVVHTERKDVTRPIAAWKGGRLSTTNIKPASLESIKKMTAVGKVLHPSTTPVDEELPDDFWTDAVVVEPKAVKSAHLKIDAEVFDFFKRQGKGHLTRMQDVLKAYVRARRR
jgi:uncharacterized protein (DUF4415 family)